MRRSTLALLVAVALPSATVGCSSTGGPIYVDDEVRTPTTTALVVPLTTTPP